MHDVNFFLHNHRRIWDFARDLIAKSGTNEEELILIDSRGCPEDPAIFPHLKKLSDGSRSLKGRFEAFKFTNDAVVRFQVFLEFCRHECPPVSTFNQKNVYRVYMLAK